MKKKYDSPDFELLKFSFESILIEDDKYIVHSWGEDDASGGEEGRD